MYNELPESREARDILGRHDIAADGLELAGGFANLVMMTPEVVVRLNEGRFPQAFAHEATVLSRLPNTIPQPRVMAHGQREAGGEYLILERLPGERLDLAWASLSQADRDKVASDLAGIVRRLHEIPQAAWMENPWVRDALASRRWRDAYHAPPETAPLLVENAIHLRIDRRDLLDRLAGFLHDRMDAFGSEPEVFLHTDLHAGNVLVDGARIIGLLDYEGSRTGPADVELDMFLRSLRSDRFPLAEARTFIRSFRQAYPALFSHPRLHDRLEVYEALWHLVQMHHWKPGDQWTTDPMESVARLLNGDFAAQIGSLLGE